MKTPVVIIIVALVGWGAASARSPASDPSDRSMAITGHCAGSGVMDREREATRCNGPWTLTFQPAQGVAAHLVGGMSPAEVKAVLDATGIAYAPRAGDSLCVDRAVLWFGVDGLEAFGGEPEAAPSGR